MTRPGAGAVAGQGMEMGSAKTLEEMESGILFCRTSAQLAPNFCPTSAWTKGGRGRPVAGQGRGQM